MKPHAQDGSHFCIPTTLYAAYGQDILGHPYRNCHHAAARHDLRHIHKLFFPLASFLVQLLDHTTPRQNRRTLYYFSKILENSPHNHQHRCPWNDNIHKAALVFADLDPSTHGFLPLWDTFCYTNPNRNNYTVCFLCGSAHSHSVLVGLCRISLSIAAPSQNYSRKHSHCPLTK